MGKIMGGSAFGRGDALIDTERAVLLGASTVVVIGAMRQSGVETILGLELEGRINKSAEMHDQLYLLDVDGAAALVSEIMGLAARVGPDFLELLMQRIRELPHR